MHFQHATLDNGLTIIGETNPRAVSTAVGFFVRTGARDESPEVAGVSHFLEHMAFKGNDRVTADDVNRILDEVGAKYNASTSEEITLFYAAILPEYLDRTFELLAQLLRPGLRQEDFDTEKRVILEEIGMYDDLPGYVAYDHAMQAHFRGHPLGGSVLGSTGTVSALTTAQMRAYHHDRYTAGNITLVAAGNLQWETLLELAACHCGEWSPGVPPRATAEARPAGGREFISRASSQQQHVMQLAAAPPAASPLRFAADLLCVIVGDESGSRLYWDLVDPGHAEAAELAYNDYEGSGAWAGYVSCRPEQTADNLRRVRGIYEAVNSEGVSREELEQAKNKVASRVVLHSERPMGRLASLGGNWIYRREYRTVADDLAMLRGITAEDIRALLANYPLAQTTTVGVGPLDHVEW
jgi:predicted Zn-dependent peptidase